MPETILELSMFDLFELGANISGSKNSTLVPLHKDLPNLVLHFGTAALFSL